MKKKLTITLLGLLLCIGLTACSSIASDKAYPIGIYGTEVLVGETTASVLYDAGFTFSAKDTSTGEYFELESSYPLEKDSYYSGIFLEKDGKTLGLTYLATGSKDVEASEAVIANMVLSGYDDEPLDVENITFDGIKFSDLTTEGFLEHVPGGESHEDGSVYFNGSDYFYSFSYENDTWDEIEAKCEYDVDWD